MHIRHKIALALTATVAAGAALDAQNVVRPAITPGTYQGPTSSQTPYVTPTAPGWEVVSLVSVGDGAEADGYRMVGIPDGLGAVAGKFENGRYVADKAFMTVFMNHELGATAGVTRAHGSTGAFVSQWTLHLNTLQAKWGQDLVERVFTWDGVNRRFVEGTTAFGRLCSADLAAPTAFFNPRTGRGFYGRLFMNGEESGSEGRAFAHVVSGDDKGTSYQLPYLGRFSWENSVAHPGAGDKTIVVGLDDSTPGQVYVYVGDKQRSGNPVERAGLQNGKLFGVRVTNGGSNYANGPAVLENNGALSGSFSLIDVSDVAAGTGAALQSTSVSRGITEFARPEDGAWDTKNPNVFYFVTTGATLGGQTQTARLYKLTLDSLQNPTGGTIQLVVDAATLTGTDGQTARSFDNLTVDHAGRVLVQEDPGGNAYIAKTWEVTPTSPATAVQIFESDRTRFLGTTPPFSIDEESSGIIEVTHLVRSARWYQPGRRYFLADMQAHYAITGDTELVEGGQLYMLISPASWEPPRR